MGGAKPNLVVIVTSNTKIYPTVKEFLTSKKILSQYARQK
jgi:hypothetical protein